jgi:renalase
LKKIAIVGAGIAGITCARTLVQAGYQVQVFEKSRGFGGRMSTRKTPMGTFDHGAPFFEVRDRRFKQALGICPDRTASWPNYKAEATVAVPQMSALVGEWAKPLQSVLNELGSSSHSVSLDTLVTHIERSASDKGKWQVQVSLDGCDQPVYTGFDGVVLAMPSVQASALLGKANQIDLQRLSQTAQMSACWAMMLAFEGKFSKHQAKLIAAFSGKRYKNSAVAWIGRELSKPSRTGIERFVVHASPDWSEQNLEADEAFVTVQLLAEFVKVTGISVKPSSNRVHRWRYAHVTQPIQNPTGQSFVWDQARAIGLCGDWCSGDSVEHAFKSGLELALEMSSSLRADASPPKQPALTRANHRAISFRQAQASDLEQLVQIRTIAMRPSLEAVGRYDLDRVRQRLSDNFFPADTQLILLVDKVVGFYTLRSDYGYLLLDHLYLTPDSQGLGIGGITLNRIFNTSSKLKKTIKLGALIGSDSNRFYTAHGFVHVSSGEFDHYYERSWS